ncbi:putative Fungal-specific transcription factor domain-containing protein [Seiridium cardinale]
MVKVMKPLSSNHNKLLDREKRQCWECLRRRLVCDSVRPVCNKCKATGVVCPGYEDKKPLKWVTPGKVTSRTKRVKSSSAKKDDKTWGPPHETTQEASVDSTSKLIVLKDGFTDTIPRAEWSSDVSDVVQAIYYCKLAHIPVVDWGANCSAPDNSWIFPSWDPIQKMAPNGWIIPLPFDALHGAHPAVRHTLTSCALEWRIHQVPTLGWGGNGAEQDIKHMKTKIFHHRDIAIRALSDAVADEKRQTTDVTIISVLLFLLIDIRKSTNNWRQHYDGLTSMIQLRGGPKQFLRPALSFKVLIAYYCMQVDMPSIFIGVLGNTTSPAYDLVSPSLHVEHIDMLAEAYGDGLFPTLLCPPELFLVMIRINALRSQALETPTPQLSLGACADRIMEQIDSFSPQDWVESMPSCGPGLSLVATGYQSAVMVFCISSLQSVSVLPRSSSMQATKARHHQILMASLQEGLTSVQLKDSLIKCMLWPLIVAGTELRFGSIADRDFIGRSLEHMCQNVGSSLPLLGNVLLKKYWDSDRLEWDECFDKPYAFVT